MVRYGGGGQGVVGSKGCGGQGSGGVGGCVVGSGEVGV